MLNLVQMGLSLSIHTDEPETMQHFCQFALICEVFLFKCNRLKGKNDSTQVKKINTVFNTVFE